MCPPVTKYSFAGNIVRLAAGLLCSTSAGIASFPTGGSASVYVENRTMYLTIMKKKDF